MAKTNVPLCKMVSFNCKSIKRSMDCIKSLCDKVEVISLQETWLLPHEIPLLGTIHPDFDYTGVSAVDTSRELLRGRPFGGVAILPCSSVRVAAIEVITGSNHSVLFFSVYMPTDCTDNLTEFADCLGVINAVIESRNVEAAYVLGDFNAHPGALFFDELQNFCSEQFRCVRTRQSWDWTLVRLRSLAMRTTRAGGWTIVLLLTQRGTPS